MKRGKPSRHTESSLVKEVYNCVNSVLVITNFTLFWTGLAVHKWMEKEKNKCNFNIVILVPIVYVFSHLGYYSQLLKLLTHNSIHFINVSIITVVMHLISLHFIELFMFLLCVSLGMLWCTQYFRESKIKTKTISCGHHNFLNPNFKWKPVHVIKIWNPDLAVKDVHKTLSAYTRFIPTPDFSPVEFKYI